MTAETTVRQTGGMGENYPVQAPSRLILGSGRSGTAYVAAWLRAAGVECSHELVWQFAQDGSGPPLANQSGPDVEASWMAVPFVTTERAVLVVRHPRATAASWYRSGVFHGSGGPLGGAARGLIEAHAPEVFTTPDVWERCWRFWAAWNLLAARHAVAVFALESLSLVDVLGALDLVGRRVAAPSLRNHRGGERSTPRIPDVPSWVWGVSEELGISREGFRRVPSTASSAER